MEQLELFNSKYHVTRPDCCCLLKSMSLAIDSHLFLPSAEQADIAEARDGNADLATFNELILHRLHEDKRIIGVILEHCSKHSLATHDLKVEMKELQKSFALLQESKENLEEQVNQTKKMSSGSVKSTRLNRPVGCYFQCAPRL